MNRIRNTLKSELLYVMILAGISEIEEVSPALCEEEEQAGETSGNSVQPVGRQFRSSSIVSSSQRETEGGDGNDDKEEKEEETLKLTGIVDRDNNCVDESVDGVRSTSRQRFRSISDSRSPVRPRSSTGSGASTGGSGPSSTCSSPRHPASHRNRKPGYPRRSLSLPNGGLSYGGDVKILYRDGHFVTVVDAPATASSSTDLGRGEAADKDEGGVTATPSASSSPRRASSACTTASVLASQILRTGGATSDAVKASMRAEILALLERGITDPRRILEQACLPALETSAVGDGATAPSADSCMPDASSVPAPESDQVPLFHSLPRKKGQSGSTRPVSVDEAQLSKFYSKSQQSLVSHAEMERRRREGHGDVTDGGWEDRMMNLAKERSLVKRNKSFNEAMGSRIDMNRLYKREKDRVKPVGPDNQMAPLASEDDLKTTSGKSRSSKGPGFIQRMLQKRRSSINEKPPPLLGSSALLKASKEDLMGSTVSLPQFSTTNGNQSNHHAVQHAAHTSPGKTANRDRDSSIGRKMSLRSIFKRKSSTDLPSTAALSVSISGRDGQGAGENSGSPPIATFLHNDDIGALTNSPPISSTAVQRRLPQRAENGEPYTVPPDASDPLSLSYPARSRPSRLGHQNSSPALHTVLGRSVSYEGGGEREDDSCIGNSRRSRSTSSRGRGSDQYQQLPAGAAMSPTSPSSTSSSLSSPPSSARILSHNSWSSSDLDIASSSEDTITSRSISPAGRSHQHVLLSPAATPIADYSFSSVSEGDETLVAPQERLSPPIYRNLTSSPKGARRRLRHDGDAADESHDAAPPSSTLPRAPLCPAEPSSSPNSLGVENDGEPGLALDTSREITSSNSNDSGIQNDANVNSSAESIMAGVRMRQTSKSPSPSSSASSRRSSAHGERPKSDTTVHWADLLEQVMGAVTRGGATTAVSRRHDSSRLRRRPRPKSDIDEPADADTAYDETMQGDRYSNDDDNDDDDNEEHVDGVVFSEVATRVASGGGESFEDATEGRSSSTTGEGRELASLLLAGI
ncbi:hypothetical protein PoB_007259900 [Plakobranchus ocellatus]|uniref:WASP family protein member n=1 Tax=Plakobranchus ocellatus TaxID=259542 RepID=A0AAV4DQ25_9GAST|nr:hypothetical protein PoB_007259900 [Plakobranchus ocellatus]